MLHLALPLLFALACDSLHDRSLPAAPWATLRGHLDLAAFSARADGHRLLAAITWGRVPERPPVCWEHDDDPVVKQVCPDPYGFYPDVVDEVVAIDPARGGDFDFTIDHLPPTNALVGSATDAVGYASVIVVADANDDGKVQFSGFGEKGPAVGHEAPPPLPPGIPPLPSPDWVLGSTFTTLKDDQLRIAFRVGDFSKLALFYPAPACGAPPPGLSLLHTGAYESPNAACEVLGLDHVVEVPALADADADALACRSIRKWQGTLRPDQTTQDDNHCISRELELVNTSGACPGFTAVALAGCRTDPECAVPEWDLRASPPESWPCGN